MRAVNVTELKAKLSAHLEKVRGGEEVVVCDRGKPIARIVPCITHDLSEQEKRLVARGVLAAPLKRRPEEQWPQPPGNVPEEVMKKLWREEREGR